MADFNQKMYFFEERLYSTFSKILKNSGVLTWRHKTWHLFRGEFLRCYSKQRANFNVECFPVCLSTVDGVYGISLDQGKGFTGGDAMFFVARCM